MLFQVTIDNVDFECFFQYRNRNKLVITLTGGGRAGKYPYFLRWRYADYYSASILCIEDPMQKNDNIIDCVKWYYGTNSQSYLHLLIPLINKFINYFNLSAKNVIFLGSSGGGYAALYMASLISGTSAIAFSPQVILKNWNPGINKYFLGLGIDFENKDIFGRNILNNLNRDSLYIYVVNAQSPRDYDQQFLPFCRFYDIKPQYGITQHNNIITWVHSTKAPRVHTASPESYIPFLFFLIDQHNKCKNINCITNLSYIFNEEVKSPPAKAGGFL